MHILIHRGAEQIGGIIIEIATESTRILLDCGMNLPPLDQVSPSSDTFALKGLTRGHGKSCFDAIFITHHHNDHCGLLQRINADIPVYASQITHDVLRVISDFAGVAKPCIPKTLESGHSVLVGDIEIRPLHAQHSAHGALMFHVRSGDKSVLYTGDFKSNDPAHRAYLHNVDALLCEGTNISITTGLTESDVEAQAIQHMRGDKPIFALCSTTNIDRIRGFDNACHATGRTLIVDPFCKAILDQISYRIQSPHHGFVPHYIDTESRSRSHEYFSAQQSFYRSAKGIAKIPRPCFLVRQTMGAFLKRLDKISSLNGSTMIYSLWDGYKTTKSMASFLDICASLGINVVNLHASGHAYRETIADFVDMVSPKVLIPIHTRCAEAYRGLHDSVHVLEDATPYIL